MKIGVLTLLFGEEPLEQTFDYVCSLGVQAVEFGTGGCVRASCFSVEELLASGIGASLDPSHLFWIVAVIRALGDASYHFHAKDSSVNPHVAAVNGVLDPKSLTDEFNRSWISRTVGYGHDELTWNNIMSAYEQLVMIQCSASNTKTA